MSLTVELARVSDLFQLPFMQRALIGGVLTGMTGGLLGSFAVLRQLSFFSDTLGHSALLGISLGVLLGLNPTVVLLPFAVVFALGVSYLLEKTKLWTDALLNIVYSASLAVAIILLSFIGQYKGGLNNLLFGDILGIRPGDLVFSAILLIACILFVGLTLRTQMLVTLHEELAMARGISVSRHRMLFTTLLALVVGISIKAIGVLLISAFVVIPACTAQLITGNFTRYIVISTIVGAFSAVGGMLISAFWDLPSGPSIVVTQLSLFFIATSVPLARRVFS
ncbi:MAG: metal ABC transporter permease [Phormidium sp. BM_Day4_Bin.17]|nr:metal ABC transporter permease [Phormidium sp. BM_Day4_Bin.17]UCJ13926.1 MAG: metal ABC transporter permease [Phormidium sp. PBR-2020]